MCGYVLQYSGINIHYLKPVRICFKIFCNLWGLTNFTNVITMQHCIVVSTIVKFLRSHKLHSILNQLYLGFRQCILNPENGKNVTEECSVHYLIQYSNDVWRKFIIYCRQWIITQRDNFCQDECGLLRREVRQVGREGPTFQGNFLSQKCWYLHVCTNTYVVISHKTIICTLTATRT